MQKAATNRVAIYVRDSSIGQNSEYIFKGQAEACRKYCSDHRLEVAAEYSDQNGSREAFDRMIANGTSGESSFDRIVVWKHHRFSRNAKESMDCQQKLQDNGVKLISATESEGQQ